MDILAALEASPVRGRRACVVQRWLDSIDDNTPGKAELVDIVNLTDQTSPDFRTRIAVVKILARLGFETGTDAIGDHRSGERCKCYR